MTIYRTTASIECDRCRALLVAEAATEISGERLAVMLGAERRGLEIVCLDCQRLEREAASAWREEVAPCGTR